MSNNDNIRRRTAIQNDLELLQKVGSGTYGEVYKAKIVSSDTFAAVKVVQLDAGDDFSLVRQEIDMMKTCAHKNIVAYYGHYVQMGKLWIVMEYCAGGSLQDIYCLSGGLHELQIAFVCRETLTGLNYLHHLGLIHRDIKGANILLSEGGDVKLADFGIAAKITATLSKRKSFIGTPYWMAPEVVSVEQKGGYNQLCDIWAMGITSIELAETQPPDFDRHPMLVLANLAKRSYKSPTLVDKVKWSANFHDFVKQCLTKHPKKRPTAAKLLESHPFLKGCLNSRLTRDLLNRVNNPGRARFLEPDDECENESLNIPRRIPSRKADGSRPESEVALGDLAFDKFQRPMLTPFYPEDDDANLPSTSAANSSPDDRPVFTLNSAIGLNGNMSPLYDESCTMNAGDGNATLTGATNGTNGHYEGTIKPNTSLTSAGELWFDDDDDSMEDEENSDHVVPSAPARRKKSDSNKLTSHQVLGLPPTPKVIMGAGLAKVFNACPLYVNCSVTWIHPHTKHQHVILGAEEGLYTLDLHETHEAAIELIHRKKCAWAMVYDNFLFAIQGNTKFLYRHDLVALHNNNSLTNKLSLPMNKMPEKYIPKKFAITVRMSETKGAMKCCFKRSPFNGLKFLAVALPDKILLFQWNVVVNRFLQVNDVNFDPPIPLTIFEMLIVPTAQMNYPVICTGVRQSLKKNYISFDLVNFNDNCSAQWFTRSDNEAIHETVAVKQLEKDVVLVAIGQWIYITNLQGRIKSGRNFPSRFNFNFRIMSVVCLSDSVMAFHKNGMQARGFRTGEVTQDVEDPSRAYRLLGSDQVVLLEGRANSNPGNLFILTGHECSL